MPIAREYAAHGPVALAERVTTVGRTSPRRVLVLYWHPVGLPLRAAIHHHLHVLDAAPSRYDTWYVNTFLGVSPWLRRVAPDAVILHTTLLCLRWSEHLTAFRQALRWLGDLHCPKIALPQDEYDHAEVLEEWLLELGVSDVFTIFDAARATLYPRLGRHATFHKCFTGYIDEPTARRLASRMAPASARTVDIVYRASHLPYWFGSHGQLKHCIGTVVQERARARGLCTDISTRVEDTVAGAQWFDFLMSGRTVLGCESGSSVLDRRGELQARIRRLLSEDPRRPFDVVSRAMPDGWDAYAFLALSPRHFEAVITKTCQVLIEGEYEGVFQRDRHYIPLRPDFSNVDEVLDRIRDRRLTGMIAQTAYEEIYLSGTYGYTALASAIERAMCRPSRDGSARFGGEALARIARLDVARRERVAQAMVGARGHPLGAWIRRHLSPVRRRLASGVMTARRLLTMKRLARAAGQRRILVTWLVRAEARRQVRLGCLLSDLAMLDLLQHVLTGRRRDVTVTLLYDATCAQLRFESRRPGDDRVESSPFVSDAGEGPLRSIVWDHGAMGRFISEPHGLAPGFGLDGRYDFAALGTLAERDPSLIWPALVPPRWRSRRTLARS
jgi:hypothetical protein